MYYVHRYLKFATFWTNTYPWCASSRAAVVAACYLIPQKNGCANILRQKTLTLVNFTTQFSYFPGCSGYLVCCMTPEFVCVMIGSKKEIGTTLIDFLSNLVRCMCVYVRADSSTIPDMILFFHPFQKLWMHTYMEILTNRVEPTLWKVLRELVCGHK